MDCECGVEGDGVGVVGVVREVVVDDGDVEGRCWCWCWGGGSVVTRRWGRLVFDWF